MSIRTILLEICQRAGLDARMGYESGASAFLSAAGSRPCAYVSYSRDAVPAAGYDTASVYFGGSDPAAARARVEGLLDRSLDVSSLREMGGEWLSFVITARAKRRIYNVMGLGGSPSPAPTTKSPMYLEAVEANSTVGMVSTLATAPNLEYSTDGVTWQEWQHTTAEDTHTFDTITLGAVGDRVYFRGDNPDGLGYMEGRDILQESNFVLDGSVAAGGNIMGLLDKSMLLTEVPDFGFLDLFASPDWEDVTALITPPDMSSITAIGDYGCSYMYGKCTSLTDVADMSALTSIGDNGCNNMYYECTFITAAADMPSLTTIGDGGCASMYEGCASLTAAADMPSLTTIGGDGCGSMYFDCTFDMSDDGSTLNFAFPTPPITAGETTFATAYDVADWMGNTNGFGG